MGPREAEELFELVDMDGSGGIDDKEFMKAEGNAVVPSQAWGMPSSQRKEVAIECAHQCLVAADCGPCNINMSFTCHQNSPASSRMYISIIISLISDTPFFLACDGFSACILFIGMIL